MSGFSNFLTASTAPWWVGIVGAGIGAALTIWTTSISDNRKIRTDRAKLAHDDKQRWDSSIMPVAIEFLSLLTDQVQGWEAIARDVKLIYGPPPYSANMTWHAIRHFRWRAFSFFHTQPLNRKARRLREAAGKNDLLTADLLSQVYMVAPIDVREKATEVVAAAQSYCEHLLPSLNSLINLPRLESTYHIRRAELVRSVREGFEIDSDHNSKTCD